MNEETKAYVFKLLMSATKEKPITSTNIALIVKTKFNVKFTTVHVRKIINEFRREELPVLASHWGYWISYDKQDILEQIISMNNRIAVQIEALSGLQNLLKNSKL
jgi:hypothetical protein